MLRRPVLGALGAASKCTAPETEGAGAGAKPEAKPKLGKVGKGKEGGGWVELRRNALQGLGEACAALHRVGALALSHVQTAFEAVSPPLPPPLLS